MKLRSKPLTGLWTTDQATTNQIQRVPALCAFWDLEKTVLHETYVSGTVLWSPNANSPHLHIHKPKDVLVETLLVIFV